MLPAMRQKVPTIAGKMPPPVMPSVGAVVRNFQLMTPAPCQMMNPSIQKSIPTTMSPRIRNIQKAIRWLVLLPVIVLCWIVVWKSFRP